MEQFATRRQSLTPVQQSHILTDIQQHQQHHHRFNLNQNNQNQFVHGPKNFPGSKPQFNSQSQRPFFPPQTGPGGVNQFGPQPTPNTYRVQPLQQNPQLQRPQFVGNFQTNGQQLPQIQPTPQFIQQQPNHQQLPQQHQQQIFQQHQQVQPQQQTHFQRSVQNQLHNPGLNNLQQPQNIRFPAPQQQTVQITQTIGQQLPTITSFQGAPQAQALIGQPQLIQQQPQQINPTAKPSQAPFVGSQPISASLPVVIQPSQQPQIPFYSPSGSAVVNNPTPNIYYPQQVANQYSSQQAQFIAAPQAPIFAQTFPVHTGLGDPQIQGQFVPSTGVFQQEAQLNEKFLKEKERIIQKHEQFVQKQQTKQQQKVQQLHHEFLEGQQKIKHNLKAVKTNPPSYVPRYTQSRGVLPGEVNLFQKAVQAYHEVNPTTPSTTTTTIPNAVTSVTSGDFLRTKQKTGKAQEVTISTQEQLEQLLQGQHVFGQLKNPKSKTKTKSTKGLGRDDLIKQLKLALAEQPVDIGNQNYTSEDIVLPDGQKVQVIRTSDPSLIPAGSNTVNSQGFPVDGPSAQSAQFVDASVLPPGANYELVKQTEDGQLEPVSNVPSQKKVTFVYLEEQDDGSYKVQGVKGSGDKEAKTSGTEVDSILKRIKEGEIKLPDSAGIPSKEPLLPTTIREAQTVTPSSPTTAQTPVQVSSVDYDDVFYTTPRSNAVRSTNTKSVLQSLTTGSSSNKDFLGITVSKSYRGSSTVAPINIYTASSFGTVSTVAPPQAVPLVETTNNIEASTLPNFSPSAGTTTTEKVVDMTDILRNNGLHAMAKYLKQSGLDTILNETGPYTVFAPTDKAFRALLVQLGGPEKAEEKFKHNPRLLSGVSD